MTNPAPRDPGLQPERTELAWRRTALALAIGSLISLRLFPEALGDARWVIPGLVGLVAAGALWMAARRRYRQTEAAIAAPGVSLPDGRALIALAAVALAVGLVGLAAVLVASVSLRWLSEAKQIATARSRWFGRVSSRFARSTTGTRAHPGR